MSLSGVISFIRAPRRRGLMLDAAVFLFSLILFYLLGRISRAFVLQAEYDSAVKLTIGLFFVALLLLQPWGPLLKRRSFHRRHPELGKQDDSLAGCWVAVIAFAYLIMMLIVAGAAAATISEVVVPGEAGVTVAVLGLLAGLAWAIYTTFIFVSFFLPPKRPARRPFLATRQAEGVADLTIFLNVILLQIVWGSIMSSAIFWEIVINTPLGKPGSVTAIIGRFIVLLVVALMVYIPPRIFFLVDQRHRRIALLTMAIANLPIILRALLASGK